MTKLIGCFASGLIFGLGLAVSGMINPAKVLGFLDIAGAWDPTLLLVMGGALLVAIPGTHLVTKRPKPLLEGRFQLPTRKDIDVKLVAGAAVFGIGWGLVGFCPGPALAALGSGLWPVGLFFLAMLAGMFLQSRLLPD